MTMASHHRHNFKNLKTNYTFKTCSKKQVNTKEKLILSNSNKLCIRFTVSTKDSNLTLWHLRTLGRDLKLEEEDRQLK